MTVKLLEAAMAAHRRGDVAAAEAGYRNVLRDQPENPDALHLLGIIVSRTQPEAAMAMIQRSLELNPHSKEAHLNLANIQARCFRMADAERHFREAYRRDATNVDAANGVGGALLHLARYEEAERYLRKALDLNPTSAATLLNMGILMDATARFDEAMSFYDRTLAIAPDHAEAHQHKALAHLLRGQFDRGWAEYAWRVKRIPTFFGRFPYPYWRGETLQGRKILVWTEQGPGDEILAATMIPDLLAAGAEVVLLCSPRMVPLFARSFPTARVIPQGQKPTDPSVMAGITLQASLGELGAALRPTFAAFPQDRAPLKADLERANVLRRRYQARAGSNKIVGLSWRSRNAETEAVKSIPLEEWKPLLAQTGVTFVSLQYGDVKNDVAQWQHASGVRVLVDDEIDAVQNLDAFAAQVAAMDLVISVSNTTVHVAGGLGRPVFALVPSNHGRLWYWFLERHNSPWYGSVRLFRQDLRTGWGPALASAAESVRQIRDDAGDRSKISPALP